MPRLPVPDPVPSPLRRTTSSTRVCSFHLACEWSWAVFSLQRAAVALQALSVHLSPLPLRLCREDTRNLGRQGLNQLDGDLHALLSLESPLTVVRSTRENVAGGSPLLDCVPCVLFLADQTPRLHCTLFNSY